MQKTAPSISADKKVLHLHCPKAWGEMSQEQLRYTLTLIGCNLYNDVEIRTYMLFRFCGIKVLKRHHDSVSCRVRLGNGRWHFFDLQAWQVQDMIGQLSFINAPEEMDVQLEDIDGLKPVNKLLHGMSFIDYLNLEACYQGYLRTRDNGRIEAMARILYRDEKGEMADRLSLDTAELTGTLFWFFHVKKVFASAFPNFFKPVGKVGGEYNMLDAVNAQIRALTDGDVTKEEFIKGYDCWRCLTELNAKAREAEEFKRKYGNK